MYLATHAHNLQVVYPKTDEQRKRLTEAVSKSFLFRALDQEQYKEVLDAIFERKVTSSLFLGGGAGVIMFLPLVR